MYKISPGTRQATISLICAKYLRHRTRALSRRKLTPSGLPSAVLHRPARPREKRSRISQDGEKLYFVSMLNQGGILPLFLHFEYRLHTVSTSHRLSRGSQQRENGRQGNRINARGSTMCENRRYRRALRYKIQVFQGLLHKFIPFFRLPTLH